MTHHTEPCPGCRAQFMPAEGPTHPYMLSSPACWRAYGDVLAREYENPDLFAAAHRFTVDAFALQHPGDLSDKRALQSVWVHYCSLHLVFEKGVTTAQATQALQRLAGSAFAPISETPASYDITTVDLANATLETHAERAVAWARSAYEAWSQLKDGAVRLTASL